MENIERYGLDENILAAAVRDGKAKLVDLFPNGSGFYDVAYQAADGSAPFTVRVTLSRQKRIIAVMAPGLPSPEMLATIVRALAPAFRAGCDRIAARHRVTEKDFQTVFYPLLVGVASGLRQDYGGCTKKEMEIFTHAYIADLAQRWAPPMDAEAEARRAVGEIAENAAQLR